MKVINLLLSLLVCASLYAQPKTQVSGKVSDPAGQAIIGAAVMEKGSTSNGVITDVNGAFTINVAPDGVLSVTSVGYQDL